MTWKFQQIEPQPARGKLRDEAWDSPEWAAEEKYDGDRRIAQFCGGGVVRFTGRRKSVSGSGFVEKTENVPHLSGAGLKNFALAKQIATLKLPIPAALVGTVLDGEMICQADDDVGACEPRGGLSKYVTSIMGSLPEEAVRKQIERGWLRYVVFDCLWYKGKDVRGRRLPERRTILEAAVREWANPFVQVAAHVHTDKRAFHAAIMARGGEGTILKYDHSVYGEQSAWAKCKGEWTADVVIIGTEEPKRESIKKGDLNPSETKYFKKGWIGALVIGQHRDGKMWQCSNPGKGVSGFDDAIREAVSINPKRFMNKVIEIAHNGREPTGRFRHPRFKRFRDDKRPKDCVYREGET